MTKQAIEPIETIQDPNPYEALIDQDHRAAVDMRVDGERLRYIAERLNRSEQTIKNWFMVGGPCHDAYYFRKKQWGDETAELFDRIHEEIKSGAADAIVTLKRNTRKGSTLAAVKVLEMAGFQPKEEIQATAPTQVTFQYVKPVSRLDGQSTHHSAGADHQAG